MPELQNISKSFGQNHVLSGINMTFEQGQTDTLVGGNGTGKTTLFNLITGFLRPDQGRSFTSREKFRKAVLSPLTITALHGRSRT
jgi:ABC-type branched-subunit amino acid transport system ATPase component